MTTCALTTEPIKHTVSMPMIWRAFGARIKELREAVGMTQADLAEKAKLSRIYIQKLELGERISPSLPALERIARALNAQLHIELRKPRRGGRDGRKDSRA
jgi:transcriptional regulator with XRE-family HTH domain